MGRSGTVSRRLLDKLLADQRRRAEAERRMSFEKKLRILDKLMLEGKKREEAR